MRRTSRTTTSTSSSPARATGTYVDVGGGHPVADNVSFWFYLKGWRGLIVEPQQALADIYAHVRPRDHTVSCLAGRAEGEAEFHVVDKLHGFSTTVREHAAGASQFGAGFKTMRQARAHALGARRRGRARDASTSSRSTWRARRPTCWPAWISSAIARAWCWSRPWRPAAWRRHGSAWEPDLLRHGYRFAFFDRLNRFYVAEEETALAARFPAEPAPWDRVGHLWDCGRAPERPDHPDHKLAQVLLQGFFAALPSLDPALLRRLIERGLEGVRPCRV